MLQQLHRGEERVSCIRAEMCVFNEIHGTAVHFGPVAQPILIIC